MRILAIGAHPDDLEFLCAGTLAKCAKRGHEVFMAVATNGNAGSIIHSREQIADIRHQEALAAAELIGAHLIWLDFPDEFLFDNQESRLKFTEAYRQARPDVVLGHSFNDYHPDHVMAGWLTWACRMMCNVKLIETESPPCDKIPHNYFMDTIGSLGFQPSEYVDITDTFDLKMQMLNKHASQAGFLKHMFGITHNEFVETIARKRGAEVGCAYAEAFRPVDTWPVMEKKSILP